MNSYSPEVSHNPEYEKLPASIRLEFFRHDEKGKATTSDVRTGDEFVRLTDQGRAHSTEVGKTKEPHLETAISFGSPRERSVETSMRQMMANVDDITPQTSLEELRAIADEELNSNPNRRVGKKDKVLTDLDFDWDTNQQFHDISYQRYLESKDALRFLYEDSDKLVTKLKDRTSTSYSRIAARFARMVKKYINILPRWKELVRENPEKYSLAGNRMERYFGSHAALVENFLIKVMDKTEGPQTVEEFLNSSKKNGFAFSEGYCVDIRAAETGLQISLTYGGKTYFISPEMLDEIIEEGEAIDKNIQEATENKEL